MYVVNLLMILFSQVAGILSNGQGPVALAFPFAAAANILTILLGQWHLGMIRPTKRVVNGTFMLAAAVFLLPDLGPGDLPPDANVLELLSERMATGFIVACLVTTGIGCLCMTWNLMKDNNKLLFLYAVVGGCGTVLNTSITKLVQLDLGLGMKALLVLLYLLLSCICLGVQAVANSTLADPSLFVPVGTGVNLVLNFAAGLCIWGDGSRVGFPVGYVMVYVIVVLATYDLSSFDLFDMGEDTRDEECHVQAPLERSDTKGKLQRTLMKLGSDLTGHVNYERESFHCAGVVLCRLWEMQCNTPGVMRKALAKYLRRGLRNAMIHPGQLVELCLDLMEEPPAERGTFINGAMSDWLTAHVPSFKHCMKDAASGGLDTKKFRWYAASSTAHLQQDLLTPCNQEGSGSDSLSPEETSEVRYDA